MNRPDLTELSVLKRFVKKHGFSPKKSLGQHWLFARSSVEKIVDACRPAGGILEIGSGPGVLTQRLVAIAPTIALDIDSRVQAALAESAPQAQVVIHDVLKTDLGLLLIGLEHPRVVVSNLPYYITAAVIERICKRASEVDRAVLMMQSEVADKILAAPGNSERGSLSVYVQFFFETSTVCKVPATAFDPPPKVESKVLRLERREGVLPSDGFFELVRAGFKQPRKTLANNLVSTGIGSRDNIESAIGNAGLSPLVRPHLLSEEEWIRLASSIRNPKS